jgi:uncharacterized delta-60 repeat protein
MRNTLENRGFLARVAVLALGLVCMPACGDDDEETPGPDAGTQQPGTDAGTDAGTPVVDSDIAVVRLNADGTQDTSFGASGVTRLDWSKAAGGTRDTLWGMTLDRSDRIVLFGSKRGEGDRVDADRVVARLTANGTPDTAFDTDGMVTLNVGNLNDIPKHGIVDGSGKIVASGYTAQPTGAGTQSANRIVLQRLNEDGRADDTFGWKGVVNSAPFQAQSASNPEWGMVEAYAVGVQSDGSYVTTGYGRTAPTGTVDLVSFRYSASGVRDTTWGTGGVALVDVAGDNDRGRHMAVLRDDGVCMVGSATATAQKISAMVLMLDRNGARNTSFSVDGYKLYDFERPEQAFFDVAASADGNWVAAAGYRAGGGQDDDAVIAILPVGSNTAQEVFRATPISETEHDRFWGVAFSGNKVYGAGFVTEGGDNRMVVARFNLDGTLDTTFGTGGIVRLNVVAARTEEAVRGIAVQSNGKVVVAGTIDTQ